MENIKDIDMAVAYVTALERRRTHNKKIVEEIRRDEKTRAQAKREAENALIIKLCNACGTILGAVGFVYMVFSLYAR